MKRKSSKKPRLRPTKVGTNKIRRSNAPSSRIGGDEHDLDNLREHFGARNARREKRERASVAFVDKANRTPRRARRWFRIDEIEPDSATRSTLVERWRASIWHGDLMGRDKSQVLCLDPSPLAENRLQPDLARGEYFKQIVDHLWMSAPRWLEWFRQVEIEPPKWLASFAKPEWYRQAGTKPPNWLDSFVNPQRMMVTENASQKQKRQHQGGRPRKFDRDHFFIEIIRIANTPDGLPEWDELRRHMADWCDTNFADPPSDSHMRGWIARVKKIVVGK